MKESTKTLGISLLSMAVVGGLLRILWPSPPQNGSRDFNDRDAIASLKTYALAQEAYNAAEHKPLRKGYWRSDIAGLFPQTAGSTEQRDLIALSIANAD